jgi:hypothetical protein
MSYPPKETEAQVKVGIKRVLNKHKIWWFCPVSNGMGVMGIPDFICCVGGRFFAIEAKAPGKLNGTTALQKRQIMQINDARGYAIVVDDPEQVEKALVEKGWV